MDSHIMHPMFSPLKSLALIGLLLLVVGCESGLGKVDCEGKVELIEENVAAFPDSLTLVLRTEEYPLNLVDPPLFRHTADGEYFYTAGSSDIEVVSAFAGGADRTRYVIFTRGVGTAKISVGALDPCLGVGAGFEIYVQVVEATPPATK